ncbi:MAG: FG-GAP repeat domain-containing protein [Planctomycetota bacterium]
MDLDGDGNRDVISGCWPGQLHFFAGAEDGTFAESVPLTDTEGEPLKPGSASTIFATDWDADGDLDLLLGNIDGQVFVSRNESGESGLAFAEPEALSAGEDPIKVEGGDSGPVMADWDLDGRDDLLVGCGNGSVMFFRNTAEEGEPVFAEGEALAGPGGHYATREAEFEGEEAPEPERGSRSKIWVTDWNNDGLPDLLIGDFMTIRGEEPELTEGDVAERDRLQAEMEEKSEALQEVRKRIMEEAVADLAEDATDEQKGEAIGEALEADEEFQEVLEAYRELGADMQRFRAPVTMHGFVHVLLRTPAGE